MAAAARPWSSIPAAERGPFQNDKETPMLGLMQHQPLSISALLEHAARCHADGEIVSRRAEGDIHRTSYAELAGRARQVAGALDALQLERGARVATLAWNGYRHLELYF